MWPLASLALFATGVLSFEQYVNDFIDPAFILGGNFGDNTLSAQQSVVQWADDFAAEGPWCMIIIRLFFLVSESFFAAVTTSKPAGFNAPSGDPHDYLSWAP